MADKDQRIRVIVRKRPLNSKETKRNDPDILSLKSSNTIVVREQKSKVDLSKYIEEHSFTFDGVFNEDTTNQGLYSSCIQPLVQAAFQGAKVTCFAYGQTGSGKTYTMMGEGEIPGLYLLAAQDVFYLKNTYYPRVALYASFYEIYCGKLHDLLNDRNILHAREDAKQNVNIVGLQRKAVNNVNTLMEIINQGIHARTTGQTGANDDSSRSHAVLEISFMEQKMAKGKMSFIDLAGSERGADVSQSDYKTRMDSAEINKSLLALKECIRALDQDKKHTPFRGSKLTQVLKDSFVGNCRTVMIANVSPCLSSCEHTLNTLRYSDRVKELKKSDGTSPPHSVPNPLMLPRQDSNTIRYNCENNDPQLDLSLEKPKRAITPKTRTPHQTKNFKSKTPRDLHKKSIDISKITIEHEDLIKVILTEEDELIGKHRKMIDGIVDIIKDEMALLSDIDRPGSNVNAYVDELEKMLDAKEKLIREVKGKLSSFRKHLCEEEVMSNEFYRLQKMTAESFDEDLLKGISVEC
ncbi:unnamed protein product [Blepharisma stoltei]|uniref:Kinesin-like protein n=1 Tax=Blepharisma stoltei TaxID=1481888 RepID=A0AAU9JLM8_9CILI|nr:unnamed protein product [Blepharisma stoltei]